MSPVTVHHMETVFSIVKGIYGREHDDSLDNQDMNITIWDVQLNATLPATVHHRYDYEAKLPYVKNHLWRSAKQLFSENGKRIRGETEITKHDKFQRTYVDVDKLVV